MTGEIAAKAPAVSVIILNHNYPHNIQRLLPTLRSTRGVSYEIVVVDNGSEQPTRAILEALRDQGLIDKLILEPVNHWFSEGNNIGVRQSHPDSPYILLLNNDTEILRPDWLSKMVAWIEGIPDPPPAPRPGTKGTVLSRGPRDIISYGWVFDPEVPGSARPDGWCCLFRRSVWRDMNPELPWVYGFEEMVGNAMRAGAKCGALSRIGGYIKHYGQGSKADQAAIQPVHAWQPKMAELFRDVRVETLDFTLVDCCPDRMQKFVADEYGSYLLW